MSAGCKCAKQGHLRLAICLAVGGPADVVLKSKDVDLISLDVRQEVAEQCVIDQIISNINSSDTHVAFFDVQPDDLPFGMSFVDSNCRRTNGLKIICIGLSSIYMRRFKSEAPVCHFKGLDEEQRVFHCDGMSRSEVSNHPGRVHWHTGGL